MLEDKRTSPHHCCPEPQVVREPPAQPHARVDPECCALPRCNRLSTLRTSALREFPYRASAPGHGGPAQPTNPKDTVNRKAPDERLPPPKHPIPPLWPPFCENRRFVPVAVVHMPHSAPSDCFPFAYRSDTSSVRPVDGWSSPSAQLYPGQARTRLESSLNSFLSRTQGGVH